VSPCCGKPGHSCRPCRRRLEHVRIWPPAEEESNASYDPVAEDLAYPGVESPPVFTPSAHHGPCRRDEGPEHGTADRIRYDLGRMAVRRRLVRAIAPSRWWSLEGDPLRTKSWCLQAAQMIGRAYREHGGSPCGTCHGQISSAGCTWPQLRFCMAYRPATRRLPSFGLLSSRFIPLLSGINSN
jgi:hypothetical protein